MTNFNIIKLDATSSSNDWLKKGFLNGDCFDGDVVWVRNQTKGRGQRNNHWQTEPAKNLTFSLLKLFPKLNVKNAFLINFAVALAVLEALRELVDIELMLKWPNDILSGKNKIGGILIENLVKGNSITVSIIGIGINVNQEYFEGLPLASSLFLKTSSQIEVGDVLKNVLKFLSRYINRLSDASAPNLKKKYESYLFKKGLKSSFKNQKEIFQGVITGVTEDGMLNIQKNSGETCSFPYGSIEMIF